MSRLALRFISGKYKGEEHPLPEDKETIIGRSASIEIVLMEDMVSRKHSKITFDNGKIQLEDLGSTNGTFVNGEKISKIAIEKGDRILIGTSIMKVVEMQNGGSSEAKATRAASQPPYQTTKTVSKNTIQPGRSMSGTISEVPLPDLLQLFGTSQKTGTLIVDRRGSLGKIHLDKGHIVYSEINEVPTLSPLKAIFRILSWQDGTFELLGPEPREFSETIDMPTEHILMEGLRQMDEIQLLEKKMPALDSELVVVAPLESRLADLSADELDIFQLVYNHGTVRSMLDRSKLSDLDAMKIFCNLVDNKYITQV